MGYEKHEALKNAIIGYLFIVAMFMGVIIICQIQVPIIIIFICLFILAISSTSDLVRYIDLTHKNEEAKDMLDHMTIEDIEFIYENHGKAVVLNDGQVMGFMERSN